MRIPPHPVSPLVPAELVPVSRAAQPNPELWHHPGAAPSPFPWQGWEMPLDEPEDTAVTAPHPCAPGIPPPAPGNAPFIPALISAASEPPLSAPHHYWRLFHPSNPFIPAIPAAPTPPCPAPRGFGEAGNDLSRVLLRKCHFWGVTSAPNAAFAGCGSGEQGNGEKQREVNCPGGLEHRGSKLPRPPSQGLFQPGSFSRCSWWKLVLPRAASRGLGLQQWPKDRCRDFQPWELGIPDDF